MRKAKSTLAFIRRTGLRRYLRYAKLRRSGAVLDYSKIFTPEEFRRIEETIPGPHPWHLNYPGRKNVWHD